MTPTTNTELNIRVQARGGMFLGPDSFNGAIITIRDLASKKILSEPAFTNQGDSGTRDPTFVPAASPFPIITPRTPCSPPKVNWVVASATTVKYTAKFNLSVPTLLKVEARVPLPPEQCDPCVAAEVWVVPGQQPTSVPGFVLEVPGLWVQPELVVLGTTVNLKTKVTMMCGCEINYDSPWIPSDFEVHAEILHGKKCVEDVALTFDFNSQFTGQSAAPLAADHYVAVIHAHQKSTGNTAHASMKFQVPGDG